uniref:Small nuclear RNA activating complex polypeptide 2 n=1 Tax=Seriola dumerili TaxID=41447 RepID=A0A3B4UXY6_SERDU
MKPPPRTRKIPERNLMPDPVRTPSGKLTCKWKKLEKKKLLDALRRLSKTAGSRGDIDYTFLRKQVPNRSIEEIQAVVDSLKNKVISSVSLKLKKKRLEEEKTRKPIDVWIHMASSLAGTLEEQITGAFSQTPAPTIGPAKRPPALSRVVRVPNSTVPPPQQQPSTTSESSPAAPSNQPGAAEIPAASPTAPKPEIPASGQSTLSPGSAAVVDTPRITIVWLSFSVFLHMFHVVHRLCPAESAIMLDLLMSLPEELPLLDCKNLHKHLSEGPSGPDSTTPEGQQSSDRTGGSEVVDSGGRKLQPEAESQSSQSNNTSSQSGNGDVMGPCPPLNPFMVPLKLLMRR